ncbi:MAG: 1-deoxy-D-xylulose-5-phosphate reductoisomerase [Planctomycetota bacterium]|jgi:1-deoxy-D-xylulose-5-phosphate reductoisomerase
MAKRIAILGSTGSIGKNALRVIESLGQGYEVYALSGHSNIELLAEQVQRYRPRYAVVTSDGGADKLGKFGDDLDVEIIGGAEGLVAIAELEAVDIIVTAIVGVAGLPAVLAAAKAGKRLAIANKEPLVVAGELLMRTARESGAEILPVDSEHCAIFQALQAGTREEVSRIILTTSGGPFRGCSSREIENVTLEEALAHPVWDMGPKITVDSATMMNKALEVIEARWLFDVPVEKIEVLVHPESTVHSLVEFVDGSVIAQLGTPDMSLPIQYALTYPERVAGVAEHLRLEELGRLTFEKPDCRTFRALPLGFAVARMEGSAAAVLNAANETAVEEFLAGRIKFANIVRLVEGCVNKSQDEGIKASGSLAELLEVDVWARREVRKSISAQKHKCAVEDL